MFQPNFSFTLFPQENVLMNKIRRAIFLLNCGFPSFAVSEDFPKLHIKNMIEIPNGSHFWYIETLFQRFEIINDANLFYPLCESDITYPYSDFYEFPKTNDTA